MYVNNKRKKPDTASNTNGKEEDSNVGVSNWMSLLSSGKVTGTKSAKTNDMVKRAQIQSIAPLVMAPSNRNTSKPLLVNILTNEGSTAVENSLTKVIGMDCEMVGVGDGGQRSMLGRVSIVNSFGRPIFDQYVAPAEKIVDFRSHVSGIYPHHLRQALPFSEIRKQVCSVVTGRIIVGHSIDNDLAALLLNHPASSIRDTATYPKLMKNVKMPSGKIKLRSQSLKLLAMSELNMEIQTGAHDSITDARAAMLLYNKHRMEWEKAIRKGTLLKTKRRKKKKNT